MRPTAFPAMAMSKNTFGLAMALCRYGRDVMMRGAGAPCASESAAEKAKRVTGRGGEESPCSAE